MSAELPRAGTPANRPAQQADWRDQLTQMASNAASQLSTRQRTKNPTIPDNFLDFSEAGFPADIHVIPVQIPRQGNPAEMAQYREALNLQWLHVPWDVISTNNGADGKAVVPGAQREDLGGGHFVAVVAGNYLMFADKHQYRNRRARNTRRATENVQYKMESRQEDAERNGRNAHLRIDGTDTGPMTIEELFEYEKRIGDEPALKGVRLGD